MAKFEKYIGIECNESFEGECLEVLIEQMLESKAPIESVAPPIYTKRKDGVVPLYDLRCDKFELMREAAAKISQTKLAKRAEYNKAQGAGESGPTPTPAGDC